MSSYDDDGGDTRSKRLIQDRQERLEAVLDVFSERAANVDLSPQMKRQIAVQIVNYHRVISKFEDESVLKADDIPDISPIRNRLGKQVDVPAKERAIGGGMTTRTVPAVDELDFWYLENVANQLERASKKLGFWASAVEKTEHDNIGHGDLAHLLEQRGQDEALEKVPGDTE